MDNKKKSHFLVFDPEGEYLRLLKGLGGERITLKSPSSFSLNLFDLDAGFSKFYNKELLISKDEILSNVSKVLDNPYGDISKIKKELKYCKNPFKRKELEKKLQGALKCKKVNKKMSNEEILKEKILNEVKISLKKEKEFLSEDEYINIFYEELKEVINSYENVEFNEKENCLIFKNA